MTYHVRIGSAVELTYFSVELDTALFPDQWFLKDPIAADGTSIESDQFILATPYLGPVPARGQIGQAGKEMQFSLSAFDMPIVSRAVADTVRRIAPDAAEFFPIEIEGARGSYEIMNVLIRRDCLDESRSEFDLWTEEDGEPDRVGDYRMIVTSYIDSQKAAGAHLFRLSRFTVALFVSDVIVAELQDRPHLGVTFRPAS